MMKIIIEKYCFIIAIIIFVVLAVYWRSLFLPFIQDDWGILRTFQLNDSISAKSFFMQISENTLFYRPLAKVYLFIMYKLFGANPIPFHVTVLTIHIINSCIVALILNEIINDPLISYLAALVYATAIAIHLDPLAWAVGIYDVGGAFFFFMSLWLFMKKRITGSAIIYFLGCLVKESVIILPIILFFSLLLMNPKTRLKNLFLTQWKRTIPFWPTIGLIITIKLITKLPLDLPVTHPYAISLVGSHVIRNILIYLTWLFQAFFPFLPSNLPKFQFLIIITLTLLYGLLSTFFYREEKPKHQIILFLFTWLIVGLSPVLFFLNHTYRYYATYSLPAFIGAIFFLFKYIFSFVGIKRKKTNVILTALCFLAIVSSVLLGNQLYREGLYQKTLSDGTNQLIRRAAFVDIVQEGLKQYLPTAPSNSTIVFSNIDIWAFNKNSGPQFWYDDGTIDIYQLCDLKFEDGHPYIDNPVENQVEVFLGSMNKKVFLDSAKLFVFDVSNGNLNEINLKQLQ